MLHSERSRAEAAHIQAGAAHASAARGTPQAPGILMELTSLWAASGTLDDKFRPENNALGIALPGDRHVVADSLARAERRRVEAELTRHVPHRTRSAHDRRLFTSSPLRHVSPLRAPSPSSPRLPAAPSLAPPLGPPTQHGPTRSRDTHGRGDLPHSATYYAMLGKTMEQGEREERRRLAVRRRVEERAEKLHYALLLMCAICIQTHARRQLAVRRSRSVGVAV
jgi:hypothetical protein